MNPRRVRFLFLNFGHTFDHLVMLLFPTVVLSLESEFQRPYAELLPLATAGFVCFGACSLPAGWLGDRWSRRHMLTVFFLGTGLSAVATGLAQSPWTIAVGLTLIGVFASIYHPVGVAMVVADARNVGRLLGINGVFGNLGVAGAALVAGWLADRFGWRAAFIVPGAFVCLLGLAFAALAPPEPAAATPTPGAQAGSGHSGRLLATVFTVLVVASLFGGLVFSSTLVALPKVFAVRMGDLAHSTMGVGALVSLVYVFGAFAQILVGWLVDRYPVRWVLAAVASLQVPFVLAAATLSNLPLLIVSGLMMFTIFGAIPVTDTLVARYAPDHLRSRVFAVKYVVALGISSVAVPLVSLIYGLTGDFAVLFGCFGVFSLIVVSSALFLPRTRPTPAAEAVA